MLAAGPPSPGPSGTVEVGAGGQARERGPALVELLKKEPVAQLKMWGKKNQNAPAKTPSSHDERKSFSVSEGLKSVAQPSFLDKSSPDPYFFKIDASDGQCSSFYCLLYVMLIGTDVIYSDFV